MWEDGFYVAAILERGMAQWLECGVACRCLLCVFLIPLGAGFSEKHYVSSFSILGHGFRCCVLGQGTSPLNMLNVSLDPGENEYLVAKLGQRWQCVR